MTAKEFVLQKYPKANSYRQVTNSKEVYYLIFEGYYSTNSIRLNNGEDCNTESKAWVQAKNSIIDSQC